MCLSGREWRVWIRSTKFASLNKPSTSGASSATEVERPNSRNELIRLSNRSCRVKRRVAVLSLICRMHGCLHGRHLPPHHEDSRKEPSMWMTHSAALAVQLHQRNDLSLILAGAFLTIDFDRLFQLLMPPFPARIKTCASLEHRMHNDSQLAGNSDRGVLPPLIPSGQSPRSLSRVTRVKMVIAS
ncbi:hypothetical protein C8N42_104245 [Celeribacter persicus]|uniref:Uncharacterized protein n=1 Tax=Celeribacter persicus TaxID=1651082 RepID=A0A2T5HSN2_9RHOB|nr:hypothetical protein C8N42_104245 [Celeribacter persicus]